MRVLRGEIPLREFRLGKRGHVLATFGIMWLVLGTTLSVDSDALRSAWPWFPSWALLATWYGGGGLALVASTLRGPGEDGFGFVALMLAPVIRATGLLWHFVAAALDAHLDASAADLAALAIWAGIARVIVICAGWRENEDHREASR